MKPRPIPTSPMNAPEKTQSGLRLAPVLLLTLVCSLLIACGTVIGLGWLASRYPTAPILRYVAFRREGDSIIVRQDVRSDAEQAQRIERVVMPALFTLARSSQDGKYMSEHRLGLATSLTSDGLALSFESFSADQATVGLLSTGDVRPATRIGQTLHGLSFLRITGGTTPIAFADSSQLDEGMSAWVVKFEGISSGASIARSTVISLRAQSGGQVGPSESSDDVTRRYELAESFESSWRGAVVVNDQGQLIGWLDPSAVNGRGVLPAGWLQRRLSGITKTEKAEAAQLGVQYFDVSRVHDIPGAPKKGVLVTSVLPGPAQSAGLKVGDYITAVDGAPLSTRRSLSDALADFGPNDSVGFELMRGSETISLTVVLTPIARP